VRRRRQLVCELATRASQLEAEENAFIELSVQHERGRIARDLHDSVTQLTIGAMLELQAAKADIAAHAPDPARLAAQVSRRLRSLPTSSARISRCRATIYTR